jgi:hypothetical protein
MRATTTVSLDLAGLEEALASEIESNLDTSGWGADGDSEYEVTEVSATYDEQTGTFTVEVEVERVTGKFAPKDDLVAALSSAVEATVVEAEVSEA